MDFTLSFSDCRVFLTAVLNLNTEERFDSTQIQLSGWAGMQPITRPRGFSPQKYTIENCLPQLLHGACPSTPIPSEESGGCRMVLTSPYPVMQPVIGSAYHPHPHLAPGHVVTVHLHHQQAIDGHHLPHTMRQAFTTPTDTSIPALPPPPTQLIQPVNPQVHCHGQSSTTSTASQSSGQSYNNNNANRRPFVAKIGAAGRKIADAVKQVGHHHNKGHSSSAGRRSSAGSNKSVVS